MGKVNQAYKAMEKKEPKDKEGKKDRKKEVASIKKDMSALKAKVKKKY